MTKVTIVGIGNIGSAVATIATKGGAEVQLLGRDKQKVVEVAEKFGATAGTIGDAVTGDIVVLAVPYAALADLAERYADQFSGKILIDVSNPIDFATFDDLIVPSDSSSAAELQALVPDASVLKAFNTNFAATLASGRLGDSTATVLVAGDDDDAKRTLIDLVTAAGVEAVSVGSLKRARELEAFGLLELTMAAQEVIGWTGGFVIKQ